jgi:hypothetical protein
MTPHNGSDSASSGSNSSATDKEKDCPDNKDDCEEERKICHQLWVDTYEKNGVLIGTDANAEYRKFMRSCLPSKCADDF